MNALLFRTRVAVLWVAAAIAMFASLVLFVFEPGALEEMLAGEMEGETLTDAWVYFFAIVGIVPVVMAVVTLLVSNRTNRYVSLLGGLVFGLFGGYAVGGDLVAGDFHPHALMAAVAGVLAFLIAGLGFVELRKAAAAAIVPRHEPMRSREDVRL